LTIIKVPFFTHPNYGIHEPFFKLIYLYLNETPAMKIAVTGASGHVGANLCQMLIQHGHQVKALVYHDLTGIEHLSMEFVRGDVTREEDLVELCRHCEIVIHLAAYISLRKKDPGCERINTDGCINLINAARKTGIRKIIHFSSIHAFNQEPFNETLDETRSLCLDSSISYNQSKAAGQKIMIESSTRDLEIIILNPTAIIGPVDYAPSYLGIALLRFYRGQNPGLIPGGYNWVDVRDVCLAAINAMEYGTGGTSYLISGNWQSLKSVVNEIWKLGGHAPPRLELPFFLAQMGTPFLNLHAHIRRKPPLFTYVALDTIKNSHRHISNEKARQVLKFNPRPFDVTLSDTIKWFRDNQYV
jgi:dihydroflavonol-4-reductase